MKLPNLVVFSVDNTKGMKGGYHVSFIHESDFDDTDITVLDTIKLKPMDHRGDTILLALVAETLGTPYENESFYDALEKLLRKAFSTGYNKGVRDATEHFDKRL